jgi:hypothetical protein
METKQYFYDKTVKNFNKLLSNTKSLFKNNKEVVELNINDVDMLSNLELFVNELNNMDDFKLFINKKDKLFTKKKKLALSLFKVISLKKILTHNIKFTDIFWKYLHIIYISYCKYNNSNNDKVLLLNNKMTEKKDIIKELGLNVNATTSNLINDITSELQNVKGNPFDSILNIAENISKKYTDKVKNGEVEADKILNSFSDKFNLGDMDFSKMFNNIVPKKEEKKEQVVIDENFNTDMVKQGNLDDKPNANLGKMLNLINNMKPMLEQLETGKKTNINDIDMKDMKTSLDDMLKLFSKEKS